MKKRIVIATHGEFSTGIRSSLSMIYGDAISIECITAYSDPSVDYSMVFREVVECHDYSTTKLIVLTDVLGGSVNNEFLRLLAEYDFLLITGISFPLLLEIMSLPDLVTKHDVSTAILRAQQSMVLCNDLLDQNPTVSPVSDDF